MQRVTNKQHVPIVPKISYTRWCSCGYCYVHFDQAGAQDGDEDTSHSGIESDADQAQRLAFAGSWALPGGFCQENESIYGAAKRELMEETGVDGGHLEYLNVYSQPGRDPRGWIISHAFFALVEEWMLDQRQAADDAEDVGLFTIQEALQELELAFDHRTIIEDAYRRIQQQMLETTIARQFLPRDFTLSELYQVIQSVVPDFEEPNFIRKITSTRSRKGIVEEVRDEEGNLVSSNQYSQRPAQLYRFTELVPRLSIYT